jgi:penicillin-binding protein 1A
MRRRVLVAIVVLLSTAVWTAAYRAAAFVADVSAELDRAARLAELTPGPQATIVFDRNGQPAFTFFIEQRIDVPLSRVAPVMIDALLAVEDRRFFDHNGLDGWRIAGAAWKNVRSRRIAEGGSTITQQLARAAQLTRRRTFERKLREALIASRLEQRYSKEEILEAYLNTVYFGEGYYGVEAASQGYFGKPAAALEPAEAALLAAVVRSPSHDAPCVSPERAQRRRNLVLRLMRDQGRLSPATYQRAALVPVPGPSHRKNSGLEVASLDGTGLYFQEELRRQLVAQFGSERVLRGGLRVYSTYDPGLQKAAESAVSSRVAEIAKSRSRARDLQGALVAMDPVTGDVLALVGGRDFAASSFNRATQARRQPGSAFKPIVYAAALERGYSPASVISGLGQAIGDGRDDWLPGGEHEEDAFTLRRALKLSSNRAAAQLLQQIGTSTAVYFAQRLGIRSQLPPVPSLALGTGEVTLLELTAAYTAFANRGTSSAPRLFTRVEDSAGTLLHLETERHARATSEATAFLMSSMLADVIDGGTATRVRGGGFRLPAAGKTGTSDDYADAWFIGYTPRLVTGVWFGLDTPAPIMARGFGGTVAVPAWTRFMKAATKGHGRDWFEMPAGVERVEVCRLTGARASSSCRHAYVTASWSNTHDTTNGLDPVTPLPPAEPPVYEEFFSVGTLSTELCPLHAPSGSAASGSDAYRSPSFTPLVDAALRALSARRAGG